MKTFKLWLAAIVALTLCLTVEAQTTKRQNLIAGGTFYTSTNSYGNATNLTTTYGPWVYAGGSIYGNSNIPPQIYINQGTSNSSAADVWYTVSFSYDGINAISSVSNWLGGTTTTKTFAINGGVFFVTTLAAGQPTYAPYMRISSLNSTNGNAAFITNAWLITYE